MRQCNAENWWSFQPCDWLASEHCALRVCVSGGGGGGGGGCGGGGGGGGGRDVKVFVVVVHNQWLLLAY